MVMCYILGCKSRSERKCENITFHTFPKNSKIRRLWINATGRPTNWDPNKYGRICSIHFEAKCFRKTHRNVCLTECSVPTLHTSITANQDENPDDPDSGDDTDDTKSIIGSDLQLKLEIDIEDETFTPSLDPLRPTVVDQPLFTPSVFPQPTVVNQSVPLQIKNPDDPDSGEDTDDTKSIGSDLQLKLEIDFKDETSSLDPLRPTVVDQPLIKPTSFASISSKPDDTDYIKPLMRFHTKNNIKPDVKLSTLSVRPSANVNKPAADDGLNYTPEILKKKWKRAQQQATGRLKKLRALREKNRRLTKKVAKLEDMISELKAKLLSSEELYLLVV